MSMTSDMAAEVAGELERDGGLPCGSCGRPHASAAADWDHNGADWCYCGCCSRYLRESSLEDFRRDFPDLIEHHGGREVITEAAVDEAIRRVKRRAAEQGLTLPPSP
jgi:hypothetical protein